MTAWVELTIVRVKETAMERRVTHLSVLIARPRQCICLRREVALA